MKTLFQIATAVALIFVTAACSPTSSTTAQPGGITEKHWKLVEIRGKSVVLAKPVVREPFIMLKNSDNRVNGHGGCNSFFGTYEIDQVANRIKFSQMASTMMACINNMEIESELKQVLETVDNYSLSADGKYLSLNRARMAPLARFELVN